MTKKQAFRTDESSLGLETALRAVSGLELLRRERWWRGSNPAPGCRRTA